MSSPADIISGAEFPTQDYIVLGGQKSPGKATVTSGAFKRKIDVAEPHGADGGSTTVLGEAIQTAEVLIEIWLKSQMAEWERFAKKVLFKKPLPYPRTTALSVDHPVLAAIKFKECQVEEVSAWDQDEEGLWSCTIKLVQFRPAKVFNPSRPLAAIPNAPKIIPTAQDAADVEIQKLSTQLFGLANP